MEQVSHPTASDNIFVLVVDRWGREHALPALAGWRLMEVIRDWGIDIKASCGGACACAGVAAIVIEADSAHAAMAMPAMTVRAKLRR